MDNLDLLYSDLQVPEESVPIATPIQQQPQNIPVQQTYQQPQNQNMFPIKHDKFTYNENGSQKKIYTSIEVISFNYRLFYTNFGNEQE